MYTEELAPPNPTDTLTEGLVAAGPAAVIGVLTSPHPGTLALKADSPFTMLGLVEDAERQRLLEAAYAT